MATKPDEHPPLRQSRVPRAELRRLVLDAGVEVFHEVGLSNGAALVTFKRVFEHLEQTGGPRLTNSHVYGRVWPTVEAFQRDVLIEHIRRETSVEFQHTTEVLATVLGTFDLSTRAARTRALREVIRFGGAADARALDRSRERVTLIGIWTLAALQTDDADNQALRDEVQASYERITAHLDAIYEAALDVLRLRLRDGVAVRQLAIAASALIEGYLLRGYVDPSLQEPLDLPTGVDGEVQTWHPFSVALDSLVRGFVEHVPRRGA